MTIKEIFNRETYTLQNYSMQLSEENFLRLEKSKMVRRILWDNPYAEIVKLHFEFRPCINEYDGFEIYHQIEEFRRDDGQYVYNGKLVSAEFLHDMVIKHSKVLEMTCHIEDGFEPIKEIKNDKLG